MEATEIAIQARQSTVTCREVVSGMPSAGLAATSGLPAVRLRAGGIAWGIISLSHIRNDVYILFFLGDGA